MSPRAPRMVIMAGPNGSGKSTTAALLIPESIQFVNADMIAQEISGERSTTADLRAGRLLVDTLDRLEEDKLDFAVETTLATAKLYPRLERLQRDGYEVHLIFTWLQSPELAVERVAGRVRMGGHHVPEETIRRRYERGLKHFFRTYIHSVDSWWMYDNSRLNDPVRIASGGRGKPIEVAKPDLWHRLESEWGQG